MAEQDRARLLAAATRQIDNTGDYVMTLDDVADAIRAYGDECAARARREAAEVALKVWDEGRHGAHGGEQANRTSDAILAFSEPTS